VENEVNVASIKTDSTEMPILEAVCDQHNTSNVRKANDYRKSD